MEKSPDQSDPLLRPQSSTLSESSFGSNSTIVASPPSPTAYRPGYRRVPSIMEENLSSRPDTASRPPGAKERGLGISNLEGEMGGSTHRRLVGSKSLSDTPSLAHASLSPDSLGTTGGLNRDEECQSAKDSQASLQNPTTSKTYHQCDPDSDHERLHQARVAGASGIDFTCRSQKPLAVGRGNWLSITILMLSVYSTVFSALWLFIAILKPRYGHTIATAGRITPKNASVLYAAFAKSIELSFVTVFVALLGQILSKRALGEKKSISIAEMSMRSWVLQPGTMITHWESMRHAAITWLGVSAFLAALMAVLYTTASDALVAPRLQFGKTEQRLLYGQVTSSFANVQAIKGRCTTPIPEASDPDNYLDTCTSIEQAGQAYHNYMQYLGNWVSTIEHGNGSAEMIDRPGPVAMLYDNTTVKGKWIVADQMNMTGLSKKYNRTVNNITMAMPHPGVIAAAKELRNGIIQPRDGSGLGEYFLQASVPSPVVNVLCAELTIQELTPMLYTEWPSFNGTIPNTTTWPLSFDLNVPPNRTDVDELFQFDILGPPTFPKRPVPYNTVFNASDYMYGHSAVYLLATSAGNTSTMCSMRVALTANCSTEYGATMSGGSLNVNCEEGNRLAYRNFYPKAPVGTWSEDWVDVASNWGKAISLNDGISDAESSNARLLTQFIPTSSALSTALPSVSEALAIMAGSTLLLSALDSSFRHFWNYSNTLLTDPQWEPFHATVKSQSYQSGGTQRWQNAFYIVLIVVFVANICCLSYFALSGGLMTDFVEPSNLFCLSLLSPPSKVLEGACGGGPTEEHFATQWNFKVDESRDHLWIESRASQTGSEHKRNKSQASSTTEYEMGGFPVRRAYSRIKKNRTSML